jgi:hypothetical protein
MYIEQTAGLKQMPILKVFLTASILVRAAQHYHTMSVYKQGAAAAKSGRKQAAESKKSVVQT